MKKVKRLFAVILSLLMLLCIISGINFSAYALESTGNSTMDAFINDSRWTDGVSWGNRGPKIASYDSSGCCAYCADFVKYCFGTDNPRSGTAFYSVNEIQAGDVLTVGNQSDGTGHWFVCLKRSGNNLYVAEGNFSSRVRIGWNYTISGDRFAENSRSFTVGYHFLSNSPAPVVGDNKNYVSVGESITFWYSGLTECSKAEFYFEKNGELYRKIDSTSSRNYNTYFEEEGLYYVYAGGYYNGQWYYSSKIAVYVFNPKLTSNKTSVYTNEEITFTYSGLTVSQKVEICFEKDGKTYYKGDSTKSRTYKNYFVKPGEYYVYAKGTVNDYTTVSNKVKITVTCNHNYNKSVTKEATCSAFGVLTYTCSECGDSYTENIAKTDHKWNEGVVTKAATCTANGVKTYTCTVCKETKTEKIKATGHNLKKTAAKAATCTEAGNIEYYTCSVCKKSFSDSKGTKAISDVSVPAAGHTFGEWETVKPATEEAEGSEQRVCSVCGEPETRAIPKLAPQPVDTEYTPGDVNGDGEILANDARLALRASAKLDQLTEEQFLAADVDGNGQVLANDARQILRFSARLQDSFVKA